ncbi:riboflavin synthase [Paenibacillus sp. strain BS8-2]
MFTGLVEEVGRMRNVYRQGEAMKLTIGATMVTQGVALGDSIAVNGVCLTVTSFDGASFTADVMPETYRRSSLYTLRPGDPINLERAMMVGSRFGGHIVQGHVDGTGKVVSRHVDANAVMFTITTDDPDLMRYVIPKGSITVDGISLTVVATTEAGLTVSIIPHTLAETALAVRQPGDMVNLESDIIGKYVDHLLRYRSAAPEAIAPKSSLTADYLTKHGFM